MRKLNVPSLLVAAYLLGCFGWPALKWLGLATGTWWRVTALLWGPWLLLVALACCGLVLRLFEKKKPA